MSVSQNIVGTPQPLGTIPGSSPPEGPKTLPLTLNFTSTANQFVLLTQQLLYSGAMSSLQSAIVNNTANSQALTITVSISGNVITIPAGDMQTVTLLAPSMSTLTFVSTGVAVVTVQLTNFFIQPTGGGGGGGSSGTYVGGALVVTDQSLDACVSGTRLKTLNGGNSSGDVSLPQFIGNNYYFGAITSGNYFVALCTGAPFFCITGVTVSVTGDIAFTGDPQTLLISLYDESNHICVIGTIYTGTLSTSRASLTTLSLQSMQVYTQTSGGRVNVVLESETYSALTLNAGKVFCTVFGGVTAN
jgi:hypothetical protein